MLADGEVRVSGRGDAPVHGDAVAALHTEPVLGRHGGGVLPGGRGEPGVEQDGWCTGALAGRVDEGEEAVGVGGRTGGGRGFGGRGGVWRGRRVRGREGPVRW
ncbi:hypothetical protein GCM10020295_06400 [Streptomyces cinereospinus]